MSRNKNKLLDYFDEFLADARGLAEKERVIIDYEISTDNSGAMVISVALTEEDPPPDLGVHVTDGIKPEMKAGNGD